MPDKLRPHPGLTAYVEVCQSEDAAAKTPAHIVVFILYSTLASFWSTSGCSTAWKGCVFSGKNKKRQTPVLYKTSRVGWDEVHHTLNNSGTTLLFA